MCACVPCTVQPPSWMALSHLECLVWDVRCGLYLSERCEGLYDEVNAVTKHIQWLRAMTGRPVWPGVLVWTRA